MREPRQKGPRPSVYPLLDPKCPLFGTIYPYLRVQGGSWVSYLMSGGVICKCFGFCSLALLFRCFHLGFQCAMLPTAARLPNRRLQRKQVLLHATCGSIPSCRPKLPLALGSFTNGDASISSRPTRLSALARAAGEAVKGWACERPGTYSL